MIIKTAEELQDLIQRVLLAAGADERNAEVVAEHLVSANLCGVDTHGVYHLHGYVDSVRQGLIIPAAWPETTIDKPNAAQVRGHWTFGHTSARCAMELCLQKAETNDMACGSLVEANHIGRLGYYVEMATERRMIGMVWAGGFGVETPVAMPYGGRERLLHTNPIAMGFPGSDVAAMTFDFATTALSGVKVSNARRRGERLPEGAIVDGDGRPSTDPEDFAKGGGALPFGGHKGFAFMLAAEFLGRIFGGADDYAETTRGGSIFRHQGVLFMALKSDLFQPFTNWVGNAEAMGKQTRTVAPAPGFSSVQIPGDPEVIVSQARSRDGIPIDDDIWQTVVEVATSVGIDL